MGRRIAKADVTPVRQRTQFTCMSTSLMMCLQALGYEVDEDEVNEVMGARPKKGAAWENALAAAQHYGCRGTLVVPSTVRQLKAWTDRGIPVMIAWNPEGREWSHASVVFDVTPCEEHGFDVHVADPNIPDPDETVRVVPKAEFYSKWAEKWPDYLVRRPAMAVEREITPEGKQVMASKRASELRTEVFEGEMERGGSDFQGDTARYRDFADAVKRTRNWLGGKPRAEGWIERGKFHLDLIAEVESDDAPDEWGADPLDDEGVTLQRIQFVVDGVPSEKDIAAAKRKFKPRKWDVDVKTKYASTHIQQQPLMTMPDYGMSMQERWERGFQANDTDSGAGSDEDRFYQDPEKREVLEFAKSKAISNSVEVVESHATELDIPLKQELKDVAAAPPLPTEIVEEPGGKALSTLNRYVVKTEEPAAKPAVKMNQERTQSEKVAALSMQAWLEELDASEVRVADDRKAEKEMLSNMWWLAGELNRYLQANFGRGGTTIKRIVKARSEKGARPPKSAFADGPKWVNRAFVIQPWVYTPKAEPKGKGWESTGGGQPTRWPTFGDDPQYGFTIGIRNDFEDSINNNWASVRRDVGYADRMAWSPGGVYARAYSNYEKEFGSGDWHGAAKWLLKEAKHHLNHDSVWTGPSHR